MSEKHASREVLIILKTSFIIIFKEKFLKKNVVHQKINVKKIQQVWSKMIYNVFSVVYESFILELWYLHGTLTLVLV